LQSKLGTTTVYVTHDQTEAMTLGDRVAVMRAGALQQVGSPAELYDSPVNLFVAGFIGSPAMNFMPAEISGGRVKLPIGETDLPEGAGGRDGKVIAGLRPENFEDTEVVGDLKGERGLVFEAEMDLVESLGSDLYAYFHVEHEGVQSDQLADLVEDRLEETGAAGLREGEEQVVARLEPTSKVKRGERAELWADTAKLHLFDPESGERLTAQ
jgi:multiple sugar transport system ATP-binding protein